MYNVLFGVNKFNRILLKILGLTREDCGRFRDCYLQDNKIIIYTRNGGGNRKDFQDVFNKLSKHKNYITNYDDDFDCTYAYIEFSIPEEYGEDLKNIESEIYTPTEKFQILIETIKNE
jgi:hypothetical protein